MSPSRVSSLRPATRTRPWSRPGPSWPSWPGSVPLDADGKLVGAGDPVRQAEQVIANLREQLRAVGSDLEHVLATEVYVVSSETAALSAVWDVVVASGLSTGPHASTLLGVACLGYPGQLVEITATAAVPVEDGGAGA